MKHTIDPVFLDKIRAERRSMERASDKRDLVVHAAAMAGVSLATFYRHLNEGEESLTADGTPRKKRKVSSVVKTRQEEHDAIGRMIFEFSLENSYDHSDCSYDVAYGILLEREQIPSWFTKQHMYKSISRQDLINQWSPVARKIQKMDPMEQMQLDFSKSRHIKHVGQGRLLVKNAHATKIALDRRALWFGVAIDHESGVAYVEYFLAKGESSIEAQKFLLAAFARKPERRDFPNDMLLQGIPRAVSVDRGSGWVDGGTQIGLARMGIKCIIGANEKDRIGRVLKKSNKKARGSVERFVQTVKSRFEKIYSIRNPHGSETSLPELNHALWDWLEEWNQHAHPTRKDEGKWNIFSPELKYMRYPEEGDLALFTKTITKKVRARLVNVAPNVYCIAPTWADDGQEIEILTQNNMHFTMETGPDGKKRRVALEYQEGSGRTAVGETMRMAIETDDDLIHGSAVNMRFDAELLKLTNGRIAIQSVPVDLWESWDAAHGFFDEPRTIGAIKDRARDLLALMERPAMQVGEDGSLIYVN